MRATGCEDLQAALACVDALCASVPSLRGQELIEAMCGIEVLTRKTHATMLELAAGLDAAKVAGDQGFGTLSRLLSAMLDLSAGQARARVRDAEQFATRRTLTGEPLPARLPATAAALVTGAIGTGQLKERHHPGQRPRLQVVNAGIRGLTGCVGSLRRHPGNNDRPSGDQTS